jgi:nucleoid DNA-binding protein
VGERQARSGRNPRMGEAIKIAASKNIKFKPAAFGKGLTEAKLSLILPMAFFRPIR